MLHHRRGREPWGTWPLAARRPVADDETHGRPQQIARPMTAWITSYRAEYVRGDLLAGVAVTALMVPHGMAYAELAGVPAVTGLYTTVAAVPWVGVSALA